MAQPARHRSKVYVVAVWGQHTASDATARDLAAVLGITLYEARLRLRGGGPSVVARFPGMAQARACVSRLTMQNIEAVAVDLAGVDAEVPPWPVVRAFELTANAFVVTPPAGEEAATTLLPYDSIRLLLHATDRHPLLTTKKTERQHLAIGRALLSAGLIVTKTKQRIEKVTTESPEGVLQLWDAAGPRCELREGTLDYRCLGRCLGEQLEPSRSANFLRVVEQLRQLCPAAHYDGRLLDRICLSQVVGSGFAPRSSTAIALAVLGRTLDASLRAPS